MSQDREPFSYERHQNAAATLSRLRGELEQLGEELGQSYGDNLASPAVEAMRAIDQVRTMLHRQLSRDFPPSPEQVCNVRLESIYMPQRWAEQRRAG